MYRSVSFVVLIQISVSLILDPCGGREDCLPFLIAKQDTEKEQSLLTGALVAFIQLPGAAVAKITVGEGCQCEVFEEHNTRVACRLVLHHTTTLEVARVHLAANDLSLGSASCPLCPLDHEYWESANQSCQCDTGYNNLVGGVCVINTPGPTPGPTTGPTPGPTPGPTIVPTPAPTLGPTTGPTPSELLLDLYETFDGAEITNWVDARSFCIRKGGRLASQNEWCSQNYTVLGGTRQGDQWTPINDYVNGWLQIGTGMHMPCRTHVQLGFGYPTWGVDATTQLYESNYILCKRVSCPRPTPGIGASKPIPLLFDTAQTSDVTTWAQATSFCYNKGGRLATQDEWCPDDQCPYNNDVFVGIRWGTQWAPIGDYENAWVQVGYSPHNRACLTHRQTTYTDPDWGYTTDKQVYESNYILCIPTN
jgi:putative hemolysin